MNELVKDGFSNRRPIVLHDAEARMSLAIRIEEDGVLSIATSFCHPKDQFKKKTGFTKVMGRINGLQTVPIQNALNDSDGTPLGQSLKVSVGQLFGRNPYKIIIEPVKSMLNSMTTQDRRNSKAAYARLINLVGGIVNGSSN